MVTLSQKDRLHRDKALAHYKSAKQRQLHHEVDGNVIVKGGHGRDDNDYDDDDDVENKNSSSANNISAATATTNTAASCSWPFSLTARRATSAASASPSRPPLTIADAMRKVAGVAGPPPPPHSPRTRATLRQQKQAHGTKSTSTSKSTRAAASTTKTAKTMIAETKTRIERDRALSDAAFRMKAERARALAEEARLGRAEAMTVSEGAPAKNDTRRSRIVASSRSAATTRSPNATVAAPSNATRFPTTGLKHQHAESTMSQSELFPRSVQKHQPQQQHLITSVGMTKASLATASLATEDRKRQHLQPPPPPPPPPMPPPMSRSRKGNSSKGGSVGGSISSQETPMSHSSNEVVGRHCSMNSRDNFDRDDGIRESQRRQRDDDLRSFQPVDERTRPFHWLEQQQEQQRTQDALGFPESLQQSVLRERGDSRILDEVDHGEFNGDQLSDIDTSVEDKEDAQGEDHGDPPPLLQSGKYTTSIAKEESKCVGKLVDKEEDSGVETVVGGVGVVRPREDSMAKEECAVMAAEILAGVLFLIDEEEDAGLVAVEGGVGVMSPQDDSTTELGGVEATAATGMMSGFNGKDANSDCCCVEEQADVLADDSCKRSQLAVSKARALLCREQKADTPEGLQMQDNTQAHKVDRLCEGMEALENKILNAKSNKVHKVQKMQINLKRLDKLYEEMDALHTKMIIAKPKKIEMVARARIATMKRSF